MLLLLPFGIPLTPSNPLPPPPTPLGTHPRILVEPWWQVSFAWSLRQRVRTLLGKPSYGKNILVELCAFKNILVEISTFQIILVELSAFRKVCC